MLTKWQKLNLKGEAQQARVGTKHAHRGSPCEHNPLEFEGFRSQAGLNAFTLSPSQWIEATRAIGLISQAGRYGGTA